MKKSLFILFLLLVAGSSNTTSSFAAVVNSSSGSMILPGDPEPAKVKAAIAELKSLPGKEKRERIKDAKKELKAFKAAKKTGKEPSTDTLLLVILAILLPPLAVYLHEGEVNSRFWISILLTILFWLPGIIYALIIILGDE